MLTPERAPRPWRRRRPWSIRSGRWAAALHVVGPVQPDHEGDRRVDLGEGLDQSLGHLVAARDTAKDVEQHRLDLRIGEDHLDRAGDRLRPRTAARVQEVGRCAARLGDHVQRGHDQPGSVAEDPDIAVQLDVGETALLGHLLLRILVGQVSKLGVVGVAEQRVVVERHLGIQRLDLPVRGDDQRVDLDQGGLLGDEHLVELGQHGPDRPDHVGVHAGLEGQSAAVEVLKAQQRIDVQ
jgi:hypothetical protein